jgi:ornithine decarboxylase
LFCFFWEEESEDGNYVTIADYINEGVYGAFNCMLYDHRKVEPFVLTVGHVPVGERSAGGMVLGSVWGPTCDSIDCVCPEVALAQGLKVGDWLGFGCMGAYTICAASGFNGFERSKVVYTSGVGSVGAQVSMLIYEFVQGG